jgi:hypothetical protein
MGQPDRCFIILHRKCIVHTGNQNRMNINILARLAFYGLAYIYTAKLIDTLFHGIFRPAAVAGTIVGLNILAGVVQLLFFIVLDRQIVPHDKPVLRIAAWLAIIGSGLSLLPKLLAMAFLFQPQSLFLFIRHGTQISAFCLWLAPVLLFAFSLTFFFYSGFRCDKPLKPAFAAGATGWFIMAAAQSLVVINYLHAGQLVWLADFFAAGPIVFVTASSLTFLGLSFFYLSFARRRFTSW